VHAAETAADRSIHLTVGILVHRWHDLLRDLVTLAGQDLAFREALPVRLPSPVAGAGRDHGTESLDLAAFLHRTAEWVGRVDPDSLAALVRERLGRGAPAEPLGPLAARRAADEFAADTRVRLRHGLSFRLEPDGEHHPGQDRLVLRLPDRDVSWPGSTETALRLALSGAPVSARELSALTAASARKEAALDVTGAIVLLRRLLREGAVIPLAGP
jgi:hypothetical protein